MSRAHSKRGRAPQPDKPGQAPPPRAIRAWQWGLISIALPLVFCAQKLSLDLWHDEIITLQQFVSRGVRAIVTDYSAPNNHIFYSLVLRPIYLLSDSSFMLRLPSLAFAAGALGLVFRLGRRLHGLTAGAAATATLGLTQFFLQFAMQVRGYSLSMFLLALLANLAWGQSSRRRWAAIALAGAAFLYTLPTNVLFLAPLAAIATGRCASMTRKARPALLEASAWLAAGLLAVALYLPVVEQLRSHSAGAPSWSGVGRMAARVAELVLRDSWPLAPLLLLGAVRLLWPARRLDPVQPSAESLASGEPSRLERASGPLLAVGVWVGSFLLAGVLRIAPFERNFTPLLPLWGLAAGCLLAEALTVLRRWTPARWPPEAFTAAGLALVVCVLAPPALSYPRRLQEFRERQFAQDGYFNYYSADYHPAAVARRLADEVAGGDAYRIAFADEDYVNLMYYLAREGVRPQGGNGGNGVERKESVYVVAPSIRNDAALAERCQCAVEDVKGFPLVEDFGYYRLFRSQVAATPRAP